MPQGHWEIWPWSRNFVSYNNVSLLNGDDEAFSIRGDAKQAKRVSFIVPFGDGSLWRKDVDECMAVFTNTFIAAAEEKARDTFTNLVLGFDKG